MKNLWLNIDNTKYENVSEIVPSVVYDYYYDVKTMDGKTHRDIKGKRTNFKVVFFNNNLDQYDELKRYLRANKTVTLRVPYGKVSYIEGEFFVTISGDNIVGKTIDGYMYHTGIEVLFERVDYDAH